MNHHAARSYKDKMEESIERTISQYTGVLALLQTWEKADIEPDNDYLRELRAKKGKLRSRLIQKGYLDV